jgi:hypothetical protein
MMNSKEDMEMSQIRKLVQAMMGPKVDKRLVKDLQRGKQTE